MDYTFDQAAALLNMGRNTLTRRLRDEGMLGSDNLPTGRWRGHRAFRVITKSFNHPTLGYRHYGRTVITQPGLDLIARRLGKQPYRSTSDQGARGWIDPAHL